MGFTDNCPKVLAGESKAVMHKNINRLALCQRANLEMGRRNMIKSSVELCNLNPICSKSKGYTEFCSACGKEGLLRCPTGGTSRWLLPDTKITEDVIQDVLRVNLPCNAAKVVQRLAHIASDEITRDAIEQPLARRFERCSCFN